MDASGSIVNTITLLVFCVILVGTLAGLLLLLFRYRRLTNSLAIANQTIHTQEDTIDDVINRQGNKSLADARAKIRELEELIRMQQTQMEKLARDHRQELEEGNKLHRTQLEKLARDHRQQVRNLRAKIGEEDLDRWLSLVVSQTYRNEIEVEAKFIYSLVKFLGYSDANFTLRQGVSFKMGSQATSGEADWVLWTHDPKPTALRPRVVIEVKAQSQDLNAAVCAQARSYSFALNAPYYLITNGRQLMLFRRGVEEDERVLACDVDRLSQFWHILMNHIGVA